MLAQDREKNFKYIVNPPVLPKVAFGSGVPRETLPVAGPNMTSFMRRNQGEVRDFPGPLEYDISKGFEKDYPCKNGFSCFASKSPRLPATEISAVPPVGTYFRDSDDSDDGEDKKVKKVVRQLPKPFGIGAKRQGPKQFLTPGPNTYYAHKEPGKEHVCLGFGRERIIWPAVPVFCSPNTETICYKCKKTPCGDYWHNFATLQNICRPCLNAEESKLRQCTTDHTIRVKRRFFFKNFRQVRSCAYFHTHLGGGKSTTQVMAVEHNRMKILKENYLFKFHDERI